MNGDQMMRAHSATLPAPQFDNPAWVTPVALADARVAIVTSAALYAVGDEAFSAGDTGYRFIDRDRRDLVLGHWSPNFDQMGVKMDLNVVYPIDRLEELATQGIIGSVAPRHLSFAGNQPDDVSTIRLDTGPSAAAQLRQDGVDVVILTPVWPLCTRTVSVLAHIFEAAGIATVVLSSVREVAQKVAPPRALHCEFPLGRPLGIPNDVEFQMDVLNRAFALLNETSGPVLVDHPQVIEADEQPVSCAIPPRFDASLPPCVDEARGLKRAYNRALERRGVTSVGRCITAEEVPNALAVLHAIANGQDWTTAEIPGGNVMALCHDIRTYYEEAALELIDGPAPGGRAMENWFFETTEAGATVLGARTAMKDAGAKFPLWFYMAPGNR